MWGFQELVFRLKQEIANLFLLLDPPSFSGDPGWTGKLPPAPELRGARFAAEIERLAEMVLEHRFPVLGTSIETGREIHWRRDYANHITTEKKYFRLLPYLDFSRVGDHKLIWELNRHQHLVLLAQAYRLTGRGEFLREICQQTDSWLEDNPFLRGINWTSALEVAFRALSWIWVFHLAGQWMESGFRNRFLTGLYRHGCYLEHNLSVYFSPNTHLLGEAVALHALGALFAGFPTAKRWTRMGADVIRRQMEVQVREDGSHFEQSSYYHLYALDFFLFHAALAEPGPEYRERLRRMADYLAALMGSARLLPFLGDDDGGRLFHPYGDRKRFARATVATCAAFLGTDEWPYEQSDLDEQAVWWLGNVDRRACPGCRPQSRWFSRAGVAVMSLGDVEVIIDAGPFGAGSGGHSHSDTLSLVARQGGEEVLIDPGTYTYVADAELRDWFRSSAAHNTVRVNGIDQATAAGPFRWINKPQVRVLIQETNILQAECCCSGFVHRRRVVLHPGLLEVTDTLDGPAGEHLIEQFWHCRERVLQLRPGCYQIGAGSRLLVPEVETAELIVGWRSETFGVKSEAPVLRVWRRATLPTIFHTAVDFTASLLQFDRTLATRGRG